MRARWYFLGSCLMSTVLFLVYFSQIFPARRTPLGAELTQLDEGLYVTGQITLQDLARLKADHLQTIIDMRPDAEDASQVGSRDLQHAVHDQGMAFAYIPIAHGDIPAESVARLASTLKDATKPVLLFCRTGNRAVRTYALTVADDPIGHTLDWIVTMARRSGHPVDDLRNDLASRIARRTTTIGAVP